MSDNVITLDTPFFGDLPPEQVIEAAKETKFSNVVIIGFIEDSGDIYLATSSGDAALTNTLCDLGKRIVLESF